MEHGTTAETPASPATAPQEAKPHDGRLSVIAAICGNVLVGVVKFIAAAISGSTAMLSEGIHSIVDSGNGILILFGLRQARRAPDLSHPFGYGKELYFWTLVVSLLIFALGGCVSISEGAKAIAATAANPAAPMGDPLISYIVIIAAMIIEGTSLSVALRQFNAARGTTSPSQFIKDAKDPSLYTVVLEDSAAELGLIFALLGIFLGHLLHNPYLDGIASLLIGALLCAVAVVLLKETKGLLVGEGLRHEEVEQVQGIVESNPMVRDCGRVLTMYMGPEHLVVALDASFRPDASAQQVLTAIDQVEGGIRESFPQADRIFIEAEGLKSVLDQQAAFEAQVEEEARED